MFPVDPGGDGAAAQLAEGALEGLHPGLERGQHVRQALAAGVVEVGGELDPGKPLSGRGEELPDLPRVGHAGGVAEGDFAASRLG